MTVTEPAIRGVRRTDERVDLHLQIPESLFYLQGHFPGFPILPGVVQIDWAVRYGRQYFPIGAAPAKTLQVKFRKPIRPNQQIDLALTYLAARQRLSAGAGRCVGRCDEWH